ncbi:excalibur calcium-binding domain-containing protein [Streptomyces sp. NPDC058092]|uniref:excalibur calcium-binding domain-containing protein n=1 Tax=Streptomyces sp. NPDC058092 TaxID=3346336 RepID=UPI0036EDCD1F
MFTQTYCVGRIGQSGDWSFIVGCGGSEGWSLEKCGSAYYASRTASRTAGAAPIDTGEPGYGRHLDRDGDGIGCE